MSNPIPAHIRRALPLLAIATAAFTLSRPVFADSALNPNPVQTIAASTAVVPAATLPSEQHDCKATTVEAARSLGTLLSQQGNYRQAAACYLSAGELNLADAAFLKALAPESLGTAHRLARNREDVKAQFLNMAQIAHRRR